MDQPKPAPPLEADDADPANPDTQAPELFNDAQEDEGEQAQTLAEEALADRARGRSASHDSGDSEKAGPQGDEFQGGEPDLIDRMNQMVSSGHIDMDAYQGERNDDDVENAFGTAAEEDDESPYDDPELDGI